MNASVVGIPIVGSLCKSIDREGETFFRCGQMLVRFLDDMGRALQQNKSIELNNLYAGCFSGRKLGLNWLSSGSERDGVQRARFRAAGEAVSRQDALEEWLTYIDGYKQIESLSLYVRRLEEWRKPGQLLATVRFELIGTQDGVAVSGIDRAYFRIAWKVQGGSLQICDQSLIEGERVVCEKTHFRDVSRVAGIDFVNQYYPPFLTQPLKFGMIRYGPGGISVVDYDNDGFYDLFISIDIG